MLEKPGLALCYPGVEHGQIYRQIRIIVYQPREYGPGLHRDAQLLAAFPDERLRKRLPGLALAADEFPKKPSRLVRRSLTDKEPVPVADQRRGDLYGLLRLRRLRDVITVKERMELTAALIRRERVEADVVYAVENAFFYIRVRFFELFYKIFRFYSL